MKMIVGLLSAACILALVACGGTEEKKDTEVATKEEMQVEVPKEIKPSAPIWAYEGAFGPQFWANIDNAYSLCGVGKAQSPVDLVFGKQQKGSVLTFNYIESRLNVEDTGHMIQFTMDVGSMMNHNGSEYNLKSMELHAPSEHTLSGKKHSMEIQLMHESADGKLAALSVFVKEGKKNMMIDKLWERLPKEKNKPMTDVNFIYSAMELIPAVRTHYNYEGSLTQPPCTQTVNWIVFNTPIEASKEQIEKFKAFYNMNSRPVQPLNGRQVQNF